MSARKSPSFSAHPSYEVSRSNFRRQDPRDENPGLMQRMEDSSLRLIVNPRLLIVDLRNAPFWLLTNVLFRVRCGELTLRDVKNEDRPGYVHENTGHDDKMSSEKPGFYTKMHPFHDNRQQSAGSIGRKCAGYAIVRGEVGHKIDSSVSSAHRSIGGARSGFWMAPWPDTRGSPRCVRKQSAFGKGA